MKARYYIFYMLLVLFVSATFAQEPPQSKRFNFPRRNSIYLQNLNFVIYPRLYYDRVIPISNNFGFIPKIGVEHGLGYGNSIIIEPTIFVGGNKHYLEVGAGKWGGTWYYAMNYRYMADRGFLLKLGFAIIGIDLTPMLGIGYSF